MKQREIPRLDIMNAEIKYLFNRMFYESDYCPIKSQNVAYCHLQFCLFIIVPFAFQHSILIFAAPFSFKKDVFYKIPFLPEPYAF